MNNWRKQQRLRIIYGELDFFSDQENYEYFAKHYGKEWLENYLNELLDELFELKKN